MSDAPEKPPVPPISVTLTVRGNDVEYIRFALASVLETLGRDGPRIWTFAGSGGGGSYLFDVTTRDVTLDDYLAEFAAWLIRTESPSTAIPGGAA